MKQLLSVWLVPQKDDENYLSGIINALGKENNSPTFIPHLTLFADITIELEDLKNIIDKVFENIKPFKINKIGIGQNDNFWKTVFLEFELNNTLKKIFEKISEKTDRRSIDIFKPHISLLYKTMPKEERLKIVNRLSIDREEFTIDRAFINTPKSGDKNFMDVLHHQQPYKKELDN